MSYFSQLLMTALPRTVLPFFGYSLFGLSCLSCMLPASAQSYSVGYNINGQAYIGDGSGDTNDPVQSIPFNPITVMQTTLTSPQLTTSISADGGSAAILGYATVSLGTLHTYSNYTASGSGGGEMIATPYFSDILTVTSATLAAGTAVVLQQTLVADDTITLGNDYSFAYVGGYLSLDSYADATRGSSLGSVTFADHSQDTYIHNVQGTVQAYVGEQLYLFGNLGSTTGSSGVDYAGTTFATGDAGDTAHFYIDSLTPGVSYTTASGQSYSLPAAVPEASTTVSFGLLLAFGMGGVVVAARKKKAAASA
ncbi:MAG: hypothetical protein ACRYFS_07115 [Janthinobacterium lividum]